MTIARSARRLRIGTLAFLFGLAVATLTGLLVPNTVVTVQTSGVPHAWGPWLAVLAVGLVAMALVELMRMLRLMERGELFTPAVTRNFRAFARYLLWSALVRVVLTPVAGIIAVISGRYQGPLPGLDDRHLTLLLLSMLLFLVARLFDVAARLDEDNRSIV